uniref:Uncharacterized protein n=1 Tax=Megaviridae environmental sample TaxID=1737588 RepID=A0A5J6VMB3_9VIRU|nr:MAG: hypothetical protein [Megaviridae environmental sample]
MLKKYKYKLRILLVHTPSYKDKEYIKTKKKYNDNLKQFHKRYVKMKTILNKNIEFKIELFGFDGKKKKTYKKLSRTKIFKDIDNMPMGHLRNKLTPTNLSLFADYNKKKSNKNFGYSSEKKALDTIKRLKSESIKYQLYVITTMLGRAKNHPHQTKGMREAIRVFKKWLKKYNKQKGGGTRYKFLSINLIKKFIPLAEKYNISRVARGLEKPKSTDKSFLQVYKKISDKNKLKNLPVKKSNPTGLKWEKARENRINSKLSQMRKMNIPFFNKSGKLKGLPTKMHTILIMWGYSPYKDKLKNIEINI